MVVKGLSYTQEVEEEILRELLLHLEAFAYVLGQETRRDLIIHPYRMFARYDSVLTTTTQESLAQHEAPAPQQYTYGKFQFF